MAKETNKTVKWGELAEIVSSDSGMPKAQINDTAMEIHKGLQKCFSEKQPKRDGDTLTVETPFGQFKSSRSGPTVVVDDSGNKVTRPACCLVEVALPTDYITAANIGLVDDETYSEFSKMSVA